jgi:energy-coupling factor transporter ATP-binding protein EcfA2
MSEQLIAAGWENYKSIPDGEITLENADSLLLQGPNGAGKTSIVQIFSMLAREGESDEPLKHGTEKGQYWVKVKKDGSEWLLRRVFNESGRDSHLVKQDGEAAKTEDGKRLNPTKKWFRDFFNVPKFDPFAITGRRMKDIVDELFLLGGYDPEKYDNKIKDLYDKRHEVGVLRKMKDGHIQDLGIDSEDVLKYTEKQDVVELSTLIAEAKQHNEKIGRAKEGVYEAHKAMMDLAKQKEEKEATIARLQKEIEEITEKGKAQKEKWSEGKAKVASLESNVPDIAVLEEKFQGIQEHNEKVELVKQYNKAREEWTAADEDWKRLDEELEEVRGKKIQEVMSLKFIDPNLFISCEEDNEKVKYQVRYKINETESVPFKEGDMNTARLIEVGIRLKLDAMKRLDQFPVLRLDCSAMDETTIGQVVDMLAAEGVFGVLEKALGRQGVDTLQYKLIESEAKSEPSEQPVVSAVKEEKEEPEQPEPPKEEEKKPEVDLTKMFDEEEDELPF